VNGSLGHPHDERPRAEHTNESPVPTTSDIRTGRSFPRRAPQSILGIGLGDRSVYGAPQVQSTSGPGLLFMQFHGGVYRSDDAGESWVSIADGLPSDFVLPLIIDPDDPDSAFATPLVADMDRTTPDGRVRVYETRDAGALWIQRGDGLPQEDAYLTILRQAFARSGEGATMELYFGATSGDVFGSRDAGATWFTAATKLPPVQSVRVA
jgi:hypothetical protein